MSGNPDLRSLGLWVIPIGAGIGVVGFAPFAIKAGLSDHPALILGLVVGFAIMGGGAASLLVIWDRVRNRFLAVPIVVVALFALIMLAIICIGGLTDLMR